MTDSAQASFTDDSPAAPRIAPFWRRLNEFFLFPFQMAPLLWAVGLAVGGFLATLPFIGMFGLLGLVVAFGTVFYFFKIAALASRGVLHSRDYAVDMMDEDWKWLPVKLFLIFLVYIVVIYFLSTFFDSWLLGLLVYIIFLLLLPATVMVMIRSGRMLPALNPLELLATVTDIGLQYALLCLFLFLLSLGAGITMNFLAPIVPRMLLIPVANFVGIYFLWVMAALLGYTMYQHHAALQIDTLKEPETESESDLNMGNAAGRHADPYRANPEGQEARRRDTYISELVQKGDMQEALSQTREWMRVSKTPALDHGRYQRLLLLDNPLSGRLATHTPQYVAMLLAENRHAEALKALQEVQGVLPDFVLNDAATVLALAERTWAALDAPATLNLLRGFDKRFHKAPETPKAYELIVRALKQGLGHSDKALSIVLAMQRRFPGHPSTEEAQWVMRDELLAAVQTPEPPAAVSASAGTT